MEKGRTLLEKERFNLTIDRLCHELIEDYDDFDEACIIGIQPRGILFSDLLVDRLSHILGNPKFEYGKLDITFYRDDFRTRSKPLKASVTQMDFLVENKRVLMVDDVLYTGRTIQAALTALNHYGRPRNVELVVLVDRRFNRHLPIQPDYTGITVDALDEAYVKVRWSDDGQQGEVTLFASKEEAQ